ncbi:hypothetical protein Cgig2_015422 [Carnegiea gigantea]|uniref:Uncharacterized protein n=1 Tax=Carnegiea gigantea TaxID=171969 RepID=A0A9Q1GV58_9CARY|nr:hypothetical protein Cgig2_015422 [Carnegiea gigantea]
MECNMLKLVNQMVKSKIEYWNNTVLCCVLGCEINKVAFMRNGIYLVRFTSGQDKAIVILYSKPFIVQFPNLDIKYRSLDSLSNSISKGKINAELCKTMIEVHLDGDFSESVDFINWWDDVVNKYVKYEWKLMKCNYCHLFVHEEAECRRKNNTKKE